MNGEFQPAADRRQRVQHGTQPHRWRRIEAARLECCLVLRAHAAIREASAQRAPIPCVGACSLRAATPNRSAERNEQRRSAVSSGRRGEGRCVRAHHSHCPTLAAALRVCAAAMGSHSSVCQAVTSSRAVAGVAVRCLSVCWSLCRSHRRPPAATANRPAGAGTESLQKRTHTHAAQPQHRQMDERRSMAGGALHHCPAVPLSPRPTVR